MILTFVRQNLYSHRTWFWFYLKTSSNLICKVLIACSLSTLWPFLKRKLWIKQKQSRGEKYCTLGESHVCLRRGSRRDSGIQAAVPECWQGHWQCLVIQLSNESPKVSLPSMPHPTPTQTIHLWLPRTVCKHGDTLSLVFLLIQLLII